MNTSNIEFLLVLLGFTIPFATATFSLVATDSETRQVGGVGATCLPGWDVFELFYVSAPNRSVLHSQGGLLGHYPDHPIIKLAKEKMMNGTFTPEEVFATMNLFDTDQDYVDGFVFDEVDVRQYIMADFETSAAYTGDDLVEYWEEQGWFGYEIRDIAMTHGENDRYHAHSAGNIVNNGTVAALQVGFGDVDDRFAGGTDDLAGRLMSALSKIVIKESFERGRWVDNGSLGDAYCIERYGTSASGAYLHIDNPDGTTLLHINIVDSGNPIGALTDAFLEWRASNISSGAEWTFEKFPRNNGGDYDEEMSYEIILRSVALIVFLGFFVTASLIMKRICKR